MSHDPELSRDSNLYTEGSCHLQLLGQGKSRISQKIALGKYLANAVFASYSFHYCN